MCCYSNANDWNERSIALCQFCHTWFIWNQVQGQSILEFITFHLFPHSIKELLFSMNKTKINIKNSDLTWFAWRKKSYISITSNNLFIFWQKFLRYSLENGINRKWIKKFKVRHQGTVVFCSQKLLWFPMRWKEKKQLCFLGLFLFNWVLILWPDQWRHTLHAFVTISFIFIQINWAAICWGDARKLFFTVRINFIVIKNKIDWKKRANLAKNLINSFVQ